MRSKVWSLADLYNDEPDYPASVNLQVQGANGDLLLCNIAVYRSLDDVFKPPLNVGHNRRVWAREGYRLTARRKAHGTQCATVSSVKAAGVKIAESFRPLIGFLEGIEIEKGFALLLNFRSADNDKARLFSRSKVTVM